jgi:catechol 2,3-dioxygenase-like lactoylglutathione lyase family enzyme
MKTARFSSTSLACDSLPRAEDGPHALSSHVHRIIREVADVDRSIAFYTDVLGFQRLKRPRGFPTSHPDGDAPARAGSDGAWLLAPDSGASGRLELHLVKSPNAAYAAAHEQRSKERRASFGKDGYYTDHVAFGVGAAAYDAAAAMIAARNIPSKTQTAQRPEGPQRQRFFLDLDGYAWEFCECTPIELEAAPMFLAQVTPKEDVIEAKEPTAQVGEEKAVRLEAELKKAEAVSVDTDQRANSDLSLGRAGLCVIAGMLHGYLLSCVTSCVEIYKQVLSHVC